MADVSIVIRGKDLTGKAFGSVEAGFKRVYSRAQTLTKRIFNLKNAFVGLAVGGVGLFITKNLEAAASIALTAEKVGLETDALQELRYAAEQNNVSTSTLDMAMQRFSRRIGEVAQGQGELLGVAKQYGVQLRDNEGRMRDNVSILKDFADIIGNAESEQEQLRIAFKLFDSEGAVLVNMLKEGSAGLDAFIQDARRLGIVMDRNMIDRAEEAYEDLKRLGSVIKTNVSIAVAALAPDIEEVATNTAEWVAANRDLIAQKVEDTIEDIHDSIKDIKDIYDSLPDGVIGAAGTGLIVRILTGSTPLAAWIAGLSLANKQFEKFIGQAGRAEDLSDEETPFLERFYSGLMGQQLHGTSYPEELQTIEKAIDEYEDKLNRLAEIQKRAHRLADKRYIEIRKPPPRIKTIAQELAEQFRGLSMEEGGALSPFDKMGFVDESKWDAMKAKIRDLHPELTAFREGIALSQATLQDLVDTGEITWGEFLEGMARIREEGEQTFQDDLRNAVTGWGSDFSTQLNEMFWDADITFNNIAESFARMLTRMILQKKVVEPLIGGFLNILPFAKGGVIDRPVIFPMAQGYGLAGEAGKEAVLPLKRMSGGDLGVKAETAAPQINVIINNNAGAEVSMEQRRNAQGGLDVMVGIERAMERMIDGKLMTQYGLRKRTVGR